MNTVTTWLDAQRYEDLVLLVMCVAVVAIVICRNLAKPFLLDVLDLRAPRVPPTRVEPQGPAAADSPTCGGGANHDMEVTQ